MLNGLFFFPVMVRLAVSRMMGCRFDYRSLENCRRGAGGSTDSGVVAFAYGIVRCSEDRVRRKCGESEVKHGVEK